MGDLREGNHQDNVPNFQSSSLPKRKFHLSTDKEFNFYPINLTCLSCYHHFLEQTISQHEGENKRCLNPGVGGSGIFMEVERGTSAPSAQVTAALSHSLRALRSAAPYLDLGTIKHKLT